MTRHVWIVEVRNPRDDYPAWKPRSMAHETRDSARADAAWWRAAERCRTRVPQYRVRKYTPEKP